MPSRGGSTRLRSTWQALAVLIAVSGALALYNVYAHQQDVRKATGPMSEEQHRFFVDAASRPDTPTLFKNMPKAQKLAFARNIGRYDDPAMARLIGVLLADLDIEARGALTQSMSSLARTQTDAVADELKNSGTFQQLGVFQALESVGPRALPAVARRLEGPETRANAVAYLVQAGEVAVPHVLPLLASSDGAVRLAAAETLGKLRASSAAPTLERMYSRAKPADRLPLLTAMASIGSSASQGLFEEVLQDPRQPAALRAQGALGLGRVGTEGAAELLWNATADKDPLVRDAVLAGLRLCGDGALRSGASKPMELRLAVAAEVRSPLADRTIGEALRQPGLQTAAARAAAGRTTLVEPLRSALLAVDPYSRGDVIAAVVESLATTPQGKKALEGLARDERYSGFIARQAALAGSS